MSQMYCKLPSIRRSQLMTPNENLGITAPAKVWLLQIFAFCQTSRTKMVITREFVPWKRMALLGLLAVAAVPVAYARAKPPKHKPLDGMLATARQMQIDASYSLLYRRAYMSLSLQSGLPTMGRSMRWVLPKQLRCADCCCGYVRRVIMNQLSFLSGG